MKKKNPEQGSLFNSIRGPIKPRQDLIDKQVDPLMNLTGEKWNMLAILELAGAVCFCGRDKNPKETFCKVHYFSLPRGMRNALYRLVNHGYEEAYKSARELFIRQQSAHDSAIEATNKKRSR